MIMYVINERWVFSFAVNMIVAYGESMWECPVVFLILDLRYIDIHIHIHIHIYITDLFSSGIHNEWGVYSAGS